MNNPSAFPYVAPWGDGSIEKGMSLRDYFAAHALSGLLAYSHVNPMTGNYHENCDASRVSEAAYGYANAMLIERKRND